MKLQEVTMSNFLTDDTKNLAEDLERQELDAPNGVPSPQVYAQLLAIYLFQHDLNNAKYLWKRIPPAIKTANTELTTIWAVGQKMWQRDLPGVCAALTQEWPEAIGPIMQALQESVRKRAALLVSQAYSALSVDDLCAFVGLPPEQAIQAAIDNGWKVDLPSRMVFPKQEIPVSTQTTTSEDQLGKLTDFVLFLEL